MPHHPNTPDTLLAGLLEQLRRQAGGRPLYLVGGSVRDLLLGRPTKDLDLVLPGPVAAYGRRVACALGGSFFYLRQSEDTARVVAGTSWQIDLVGLRGTIDDDLRRRDFTVNAMAVDLAGGVPPLDPGALREVVIDPLGGRDDIACRLLRRCAPDSLARDPLRALRAVRLAAGFDWRIEPATGRQIASSGPDLARVSTERIRDELFLLLMLRPAARRRRALHLLRGLRLLEPALRGHADPHGIERSAALDAVIHQIALTDDSLASAVGSYLHEAITPPRSRAALLRLAALIGPDSARGRPAAPALRDLSSAHGSTEDRSSAHGSTEGRSSAHGPGADHPATYGPSLHQPPVHPGAAAAPSNPRAADPLRSRLELSAAESRFVHRAWEGEREARRTTSGDLRDPLVLCRFFTAFGDTVPAALLLALADEFLASRAEEDTPGSGGEAVPKDGAESITSASSERRPSARQGEWIGAMAAWFLDRERYLPPPFLTGDDLMRGLNRRGGPWVAALLRDLQEAQVTGAVEDREAAWDFVRRRNMP